MWSLNWLHLSVYGLGIANLQITYSTFCKSYGTRVTIGIAYNSTFMLDCPCNVVWLQEAWFMILDHNQRFLVVVTVLPNDSNDLVTIT